MTNVTQRVSVGHVSGLVQVPSAPLTSWPIPGGCAIQTRQPAMARELRRIQGAHLAAWSVLGGYLRVFHYNRPAAWARGLVTRWLRYANEAKQADFSIMGRQELEVAL